MGSRGVLTGKGVSISLELWEDLGILEAEWILGKQPYLPQALIWLLNRALPELCPREGISKALSKSK